ncbi:MAG: ABC transporter substrate-binding protein [Coriobacteriia bacterium]|nr:ABC transporter substrate-binding protein [Coriobacteriia bacterium]
MRQVRRVGIAAAVAALALCALLPLGGCAGGAEPPSPLTPQLAPPTIHEAGVLRAGVDLSYPPFGGVQDSRQAGLDIDVASALAGRLGLKVQIIDVKASELATALADNRIDVGLSAPFSADVLTRASIAGTYLADGPALFSTATSMSVTPTSAAGALDGVKIGAQQDSEAYWLLAQDRGTGGVAAFPTLREALAALVRGDVAAVGGDALVGAYMARDYPSVRYAGALATAHPLGIAVSADNSRLGDAVRLTLDSMASDGVLEAIRATWVGGLPKLPLAGEDASTVPLASEVTSTMPSSQLTSP